MPRKAKATNQLIARLARTPLASPSAQSSRYMPCIYMPGPGMLQQAMQRSMRLMWEMQATCDARPAMEMLDATLPAKWVQHLGQ